MDQIFRLWDRFDSSDADEMVIETSEFSFKLRRNATSAADTTVVTEKKNYNSMKKPNMIHTTTKSVSEDVSVAESGKIEIKAPLAGIFYRASAPDAEPFVKIGDKVKKGDVVGIVEAMKMMNEITAAEDGVVASILAQDSTMVEYDQTLITLR